MVDPLILPTNDASAGTWDEILNDALTAINNELKRTTAVARGVGSAADYHTSLTAARNPDVPRNVWLSPDGSIPTNYVDGDLLLVPSTSASRPGKVTGVASANLKATSATISYSGVASAIEYEVSYKKSADASFAIAGTTTGTSFELTGLVASTQYDVRVRARNEAGFGEYSDVHVLTTAAAGPYSEHFDATGTAGWVAKENVAAGSIVRDTTQDAGGTATIASLAWSSAALGKTSVAGPEFAVAAATGYTERVFIRHNDANAHNARVAWNELDAGGGYRGTKISTPDVSIPANTWVEVALGATTNNDPAGPTARLSLYVELEGMPTAATCYIDRVRVTQP